MTVEERTLRDVLQEGTPPFEQALSMALEIAGGLAEAHENGIVHRDLRTESVLVTARGRVRILGLARPARDGLFSGVRALSPEQAQGLGVDRRSDLFSLGSLLYELFTGRHPFAGSNLLETMANLCNRTQEPAKVVRPSVPSKLSILVDRLLAKSPDDRPQSAGEVVAVLGEVLGRPASPSAAVRVESGDETGVRSVLGRHVGNYRVEQCIEERIDTGGLGDVYRAWDEHMERPVALRRIRRGGSADDFRHEACAISGIHHAAVVRVFDIVETEDDDWLVLELLEGVPLRQLMESTALDLEVAVELARQVADGLAEIHAHGIVHRDLKAGNVLVTMVGGVPRQAKILNAGPATLRALSPEQAIGQPLDERSDLFSFGMLLYEMITRQHPFAGRGFFQPLLDLQRRQQVPAWEVNNEVPEELSILVDQLLAKNPAHRPPSARAVRRVLDTIQRRLLSLEAETVVGARLPRSLTRLGPPTGRPRRPGLWRWAATAFRWLSKRSARPSAGPRKSRS